MIYKLRLVYEIDDVAKTVNVLSTKSHYGK